MFRATSLRYISFLFLFSVQSALAMQRRSSSAKSKEITLPQAVFNGQVDSIDRFFKNGHTVDLSVQYGRGENSLFHSAALSEKQDRAVSIIELLHKVTGGKGFESIDVKNVSGQTPLHIAAARGNVQMIRCLCRYGANPAIKDSAGFSSFEYIVNSRDDELINFVFFSAIKHQHHFSKERMSIDDYLAEIEHAIIGGRCDEATIINRLDVAINVGLSERILNGDELQRNLVAAAMQERLQLLDWYMQKGVNFAVRDNQNNSLLHHATRYARPKVIKKIMDHCKNKKRHERAALYLNSANKNGDTALHIAARGYSIDTLNALLAYDPDLTIKNSDNKTPKDIAAPKDELKYILLDEAEKKQDYDATLASIAALFE